MDERFLLKLSVALSIIGLAVLFIFSQFLETPEQNIAASENNDYAVFKGYVENIYEKENFTVILFSQESKATIFFFSKDKFPIQKGQKIEVKGKLTIEENQATIVADEIRLGR
jgi:hypothetical protein